VWEIRSEGWLGSDLLGGSAIRRSDENGAITLEPTSADQFRSNCFYRVAIRFEDVERVCSVSKVIIESFLSNRARNPVQLVDRVELHNLTIIIPVGIRQKQDCHCEFSFRNSDSSQSLTRLHV
jgi:hypothetical protein